MSTIGGLSLFNKDDESLRDFAFGKSIMKGYTVNNGQQLDLSRLAQVKCGTFSVSFWLRATGNAKIIGATSVHRKVLVHELTFGVLY